MPADMATAAAFTDPETPPGVYADVPPDTYHQHPALSASGAKLLLPPSCPARFRWERDHPTPPTAAMERGTAAHTLVLGTGHPLELIPYDDWRSAAAKTAVAAARDAGNVPVKPDQHQQLTDMAAALRAHPYAAALLDPAAGTAEQSLVWNDKRTGMPRRCRLDWLPEPLDDGRLIVADYKTAKSAHPDEFARAMYGYGYDMQAANNLDGITTLGLADRPVFVFIVQEVAPPYVVTVVQPDLNTLRIGDLRMRRALDLYARCLESDTWPGYTQDVATVTLPHYIARDYDQETSR